MEKILHPMHLSASLQLQMMFLEDVYFDYQDYEIADWLKGLDESTIEEIINRQGHESLKANSFVIPYTYLKYHVVPKTSLVSYLKTLMHHHRFIDDENPNLKNMKLNFDQIFTGKTSYAFNPEKSVKKY
jgi:hypothetical protein